MEFLILFIKNTLLILTMVLEEKMSTNFLTWVPYKQKRQERMGGY